MFGKPEWFRKKQLGWGLVPISWQGWAYTALWASAIGLPFVVLVERHQGIEALIWMVASIGALVWDVRGILDAMSPAESADPIYIGPDEPASFQTAAHRIWRCCGKRS